MAVANPLDSFVKNTVGKDVRIPELPSLAEYVRTHGLMAGLSKHQEALGSWRSQMEQMLNERLQAQTAAVSTPATTSPTTTVTAPAASSGGGASSWQESRIAQLESQVNTLINSMVSAATMQIVYYTADPNIEGFAGGPIKPENVNKPAMAWTKDGKGQTYSWNTDSKLWN